MASLGRTLPNPYCSFIHDACLGPHRATQRRTVWSDKSTDRCRAGRATANEGGERYQIVTHTGVWGFSVVTVFSS